ncbi:hypothetical protein Trisim1_001422 [Trichoderma cf. simile WF8]
MSLPRARAVVQRGDALISESVELPALQEHQVYVKVEYAAFNPTDGLAFELNAFGDGAILGCDFAGVVTHIHPNVTKLATGDRVAALVWGGEIKGIGAYSSYCIADERISFKIPANVDYAAACAVPLAANTAWLALFSKDCLAIDRNVSATKPQLLVWGGGTTVGYFAIQIAKLHGIITATTCSPRNFQRAKDAGATHVFDYNDKDVVSNIQATLPNITHIFDTVGSATSSITAAEVIGSSSGALCTVRPGKSNTIGVKQNVKVTDVFVFKAFPWAHSYRGLVQWPLHKEDHELSMELYRQLPSLVRNGFLTTPVVTLLGALNPDVVMLAIDRHRNNQISGQKLYFKVSGE